MNPGFVAHYGKHSNPFLLNVEETQSNKATYTVVGKLNISTVKVSRTFITQNGIIETLICC